MGGLLGGGGGGGGGGRGQRVCWPPSQIIGGGAGPSLPPPPPPPTLPTPIKIVIFFVSYLTTISCPKRTANGQFGPSKNSKTTYRNLKNIVFLL